MALGDTCTLPMTASSSATVTPPGRSTVGGSVVVSTTVDSSPTSVSSDTMMAETRPIISSITCSLFVGLGRPEILALGAAMGTPADLMSPRAMRLEGKRTATVSSPAVTTSGTPLLLCMISVKGPGQ